MAPKHGHRGHPGSLQRRLFVWFGVSMLCVALLAGLIVFLVKPSKHVSMHAATAFVAHRFEERWDVPAERQALAKEIYESLNLNVTLEDEQGQLLLNLGERCGPEAHAVVDEKVKEGRVRLCKDNAPPIWILFFLFVGALWFVSGRIANKLTRTLKRVAVVASRIGDGDYSARIEETRHLPNEVLQVSEAINDMAARVEAANEEQKMLFASVSHEIRTPLGHARILVDKARDQGANDGTMDELEHEILEIDDLVGQLLAGSKVDAIGAERRQVDVTELARRALSRMGENEAKLNAQDGLKAMADPTLLSRAISNLIRNAKEHGEGLQTLQVESDESTVSFCVRDNGPGMQKEQFERLIKPFARDGADSKGSLGIGLALCSRIAIAHGGTLKVAEGKGVVLTIPVG